MSDLTQRRSRKAGEGPQAEASQPVAKPIADRGKEKAPEIPKRKSPEEATKLKASTDLRSETSRRAKALISAVEDTVVRESISCLQTESDLLRTTRIRLMKTGVDVNKSQLFRAGIAHLASLDDDALVAAVNSLKPIRK